jgi:hypothetical protein
MGVRMSQIWPFFIALCFFIGLGLWSSSFCYPWYNVPESEVHQLAYRLEELPRDTRWKLWNTELKKLETPRKSLRDIGIGVLTLSCALAALYAIFRFPLYDAKTFKSRTSCLIVYLLALAVQIPYETYFLWHRLRRGDYPVWGDSIGIGLYQNAHLCVVLAVIGTPLLALLLWKIRLPCRIFIWAHAHITLNLIVIGLLSPFVLLSLFILCAGVVDGHSGEVISI